MGFGIGILITGGNLYGGVHKIQNLIREKLEEILRFSVAKTLRFKTTKCSAASPESPGNH